MRKVVPPALVARVAGISRQASYRRPKRPPAGERRQLTAIDEVVLDVARSNPTDGTRMGRELGGAVNRKRVQQLMREHGCSSAAARSDGGGGRGSSASSTRTSSGTWT